jgi:uncharacterized protein YuzE
MIPLTEAFPSLVRELVQQLRAGSHATLADQVDSAIISKVTFDPDANAGYIYLRPSHDLNVVEKNIIGAKHRETKEVETQYWTMIDIDNFDRIVGIEVLSPGDIKASLMQHAGT